MFIVTVILLQYMQAGGALLYTSVLVAMKLMFPNRLPHWLPFLIVFSFGYTVWSFLYEWIVHTNIAGEWKIIGSRIGLLGFIVPFAIIYKNTYLSFGSFRRKIYFPWITKGFIEDPIWRFILIGIGIMTGIFSIFIDYGRADLLSLLGYGILFAFVNSVLEEILWRGYVLGEMVKKLGVTHGLWITSLCFGLYHYSLGFSWFICMAFAMGGLVFGGLSLRSRGIAAPMIMHFVMNILFVLSGIIF